MPTVALGDEHWCSHGISAEELLGFCLQKPFSKDRGIRPGLVRDVVESQGPSCLTRGQHAGPEWPFLAGVH